MARSKQQTASGLPAKLVAIGRWTWPAIIPTTCLAGRTTASSRCTQASQLSALIQSMPVSTGG